MKYKKAIFFSITALLVLGLLFFFLLLRKELPLTQEESIIVNRVSAISEFVVDIEESYIPRIINTIARKRFMNAEDFVRNDMDCIEESIIRGSCILPLDPDNTLRNKLAGLELLTEKELPVTLTFEKDDENRVIIRDLQIRQRSSLGHLNMTISVVVNYNVTSALANWTREDVIIETVIPIQGFQVPLVGIGGVTGTLGDMSDVTTVGGGMSFVRRWGGSTDCCKVTISGDSFSS